MEDKSERDAEVNRLVRIIFEKEDEDPRKADKFIDYFSTHHEPVAQYLGQIMRRFMNDRREFIAHGTYHGIPVYNPDEWSGPIHRSMTHFPDGTAEGTVTLPLARMKQYQQYCKYCYTTHNDWWMMDQRDYLCKGLTIILCRCGYTSPQDHETQQNPFTVITQAMIDESIQSFKAGKGSGTGRVRSIPRHLERKRKSS